MSAEESSSPQPLSRLSSDWSDGVRMLLWHHFSLSGADFLERQINDSSWADILCSLFPQESKAGCSWQVRATTTTLWQNFPLPSMSTKCFVPLLQGLREFKWNKSVSVDSGSDPSNYRKPLYFGESKRFNISESWYLWVTFKSFHYEVWAKELAKGGQAAGWYQTYGLNSNLPLPGNEILGRKEIHYNSKMPFILWEFKISREL